MSTIPGITHLPAASITCGHPAVSSSCGVIAAIRPPLIPMLRTAEAAPVPSNQRPFMTMVS